MTSYAFDPLSRFSQTSHDLGGTAQDVTTSFSYNPAGQIVSKTRSNDSYTWNGHVNVSRNYTTNGLNQYSAAGAVAFGYDGSGNLTSSGSTIYSYSSENLMISGAQGGLQYDPALRLYETSSAAYGTTRFGYDGVDLVGEYDAANILQRRYVHGPGSDEPIVWYEGAGLSDKRFLHGDERGSIIAICDASGSVININSYDDYGIPASTNLGRFGYTGQTWLPNLGMYYYKARIYSPTLGRFMQSDPIGYSDGPNLYNYVGSDPVNARDPSGLRCSDIGRFSNPYCDRAFPDDDGPQLFVTGGVSGSGGGGGIFGDPTSCTSFHETYEGATSACRGQPGGGDGGNPNQAEQEPREPDILACLRNAGTGFVQGAFDPTGVALALGVAAFRAVNRTAPQDYRPLSNEERSQPRNRGTLTRSFGSALRIGATRVIPGYLAISGAIGVINAVVTVANDPNCRTKRK